MPWKLEPYSKSIWRSPNFLLFFISQVVSGLGDTFQLIAATALLVKITGSGLAAGFGIICTPLPSIFLSLLAGSLGDRWNEKYMLILVDLLRAVVVVLFAFHRNIFLIYALLLILSSLDTLYYPSRNKMLRGILKNRDLMVGNSILSGGYGAVYLLGPVLAGVLVGLKGVEIAFFINSVSFIISALIICNIKGKPVEKSRQSRNGIFRHVKEGVDYCRSLPVLRDVIGTAAVVCIGTASVNIAFYPFAFDVLGVSSQGWGMMLSILYGTSLLAMCITFVMNKKGIKHPMSIVTGLLLLISMIWLFYSRVNNLLQVLLLQVVEGTVLSVCSILMSTQIQLTAKKAYIARAMGANDIATNLGRILGVSLSYLTMRLFSVRSVFMASSLMLFTFSAYKLLNYWSISGKSRMKNKFIA